jgi:hypothetical protein
MKDREGLKCVTWGLREALNTSGTDAAVATKVARALGVPHQYFPTDLGDEPPQRILERFLVAGDGRLDHISGYMDGFELWRSMWASGVIGIIRGDHGFGHRVVTSDQDARLRVGMILWSDYRDVPALADLDLQHLGEQRLPPALEHQAAESAEDWRDRLFHAFRIPYVYAALNELKSPYVEIASPLLVRRIVELARAHPAHLRTGKRLFRDLTAEMDIPVDFADEHATESPDRALGQPAVMQMLLDEISSARTRETLSVAFASYVAGLVHRPMRRRRDSRYATIKRTLKRTLPKRIAKAFIRPPDWRALSGRRLALRSYIITQMYERLRRDGQSAQATRA